MQILRLLNRQARSQWARVQVSSNLAVVASLLFAMDKKEHMPMCKV